MNKREATKQARLLVKALGMSWQAVCWKNIGWHYKAISKTGSIQVYPSTIKGEYTAYIGEPLSIGGDGELIGRGNSPQKAVQSTVRKVRRHIAMLERWLEGREVTS